MHLGDMVKKWLGFSGSDVLHPLLQGNVNRPDCEEHLLWVTTAVLIARRLQLEDRARIDVQSTAHWMPLSGRLQSTLMGEVKES